ncbi:MAG: S8 family serine peptidase [Acidimicrobiia bacterium]
MTSPTSARAGADSNPPTTAAVAASAKPREFWVATFAERPDLRAAVREAGWNRRGRLTVVALRRAYRNAAGRPAVLRLLRSRRIMATPLWVSNAVLFHAPKIVADRVAQIAGVTEVVGGRELDLGAEVATAAAGNQAAPTTVPSNLVESGVPGARAAGVTGRGAVVGIVDSGVDARHPDLADNFRRKAGWFDPTGRCPDAPCDDSGHGTAVAGLAVGTNTGVAPGAQWIAARGCTAEQCTLELVLQSLQFMLAPDAGRGADPDLRPDFVNNSWSIKEPSTSLGRAMTALHAAGILSVFAAGNTGPTCRTVGFPASQPEVIAVGATDGNGRIARFSARGPGPLGPEPTLVAPGLDVLTTAVGGGYTRVSGTSMAAPEVTGTYALALETAPKARGRDALHRTVVTSAARRPADTCRTSGVPNSDYGYGTLDAAAAVAAARALVEP